MPEIWNVQNVIGASLQLTASAFTVVFLICLIMMKKTRLMQAEVYKEFIVSFTLMLLYLLADAFAVLADGGLRPRAVLAVGLGRMVAFLVLPSLVLSVSWFMLSFLPHGLRQRIFSTAACFTMAAELMVVVSPWTQWVYYIDSANVYHRGQEFFLFTLLTCVPGLADFGLTLVHWKELPKVARFSMMFLLLFPAVSIPVMLRYPRLPMIQMTLYCDMVFAFLMIVIVETRAAARQQQELELERQRLIAAQLKPHFLSNALLSISGDPDMPPAAREALNAFSRYLRHNLTVLEADGPVPVSEELEQVKNYLLLEKRRFGDKLNYTIQPGITGFRVPPLSVQTLAENAVRHGITRGTGHGTVSITTGRQDNEAWLCVADDGAGFDPAALETQTGQHTGLRITRDRVRIMCGGRLQLESSPGAGTRATLWIPLKENKG